MCRLTLLCVVAMHPLFRFFSKPLTTPSLFLRRYYHDPRGPTRAWKRDWAQYDHAPDLLICEWLKRPLRLLWSLLTGKRQMKDVAQMRWDDDPDAKAAREKMAQKRKSAARARGLGRGVSLRRTSSMMPRTSQAGNNEGPRRSVSMMPRTSQAGRNEGPRRSVSMMPHPSEAGRSESPQRRLSTPRVSQVSSEQLLLRSASGAHASPAGHSHSPQRRLSMPRVLPATLAEEAAAAPRSPQRVSVAATAGSGERTPLARRASIGGLSTGSGGQVGRGSAPAAEAKAAERAGVVGGATVVSVSSLIGRTASIAQRSQSSAADAQGAAGNVAPSAALGRSLSKQAVAQPARLSVPSAYFATTGRQSMSANPQPRISSVNGRKSFSAAAPPGASAKYLAPVKSGKLVYPGAPPAAVLGVPAGGALSLGDGQKPMRMARTSSIGAAGTTIDVAAVAQAADQEADEEHAYVLASARSLFITRCFAILFVYLACAILTWFTFI